MRLAYKSVTKEGKIIRGIIEAKDVKEAASYLRKRQLIPVSISDDTSSDISKLLPFVKKIKNSDIVFFTRQLASMLDAGLTLVQSLSVLRDQTTNSLLKGLVGEIIIDIQEGKTFSSSISRHADVFSSVYISLIKAGEGSGLLDKSLNRLADNLEKEQKLKGTIKGALINPTIVIMGMIIVGIVMMIFVVPQLSSLYKTLNADLPLPTQIVIAISNFTITFWPVVLAGSVLFAFLFNKWRKTETGKLILDDFMLRLPIFGKLIRHVILAEITRTLGILIGSGALIVDSLREAANVSGNTLYKNSLISVSMKVERGITIGDSMKYSSLFPPILVELVKIGEQTGKLDESLLRVSEYYEREVDQTTRTLTVILEPLIIAILGTGVGFLILSIITPLYGLLDKIK